MRAESCSWSLVSLTSGLVTAGALAVLSADAVPAWAQGAPRSVARVEITVRGGNNGDSVLQSVSDVAVGARGEFVVVDQRARHVKVFDSTGVLRRIVGRAGSGPGEFGPGVSKVLVARDGRIVVPEATAARAQWFDADGKFTETLAIPRGGDLPLGFAVTADGTLHQAVAKFTVADGARVLDSLIEVRALTDGIPRIVAKIATGVPPQAPLSYGVSPTWSWNGVTEMVAGSGVDFNLRLHDADGRLMRVWSRTFTRAPISSADRDLLINAIVAAAAGPPEIRPALAERLRSSFAAHYPAFVALLVADDGTVWAQLPVTAADLRGGRVRAFDFRENIGLPIWEVFSREGTFLRRVEVPPGFHLTRVIGGRLYGYSIDDAGEPVAQRLRFEPQS